MFPADLFHSRAMFITANGQKMHHGVAILSWAALRDPGRHDWQTGEAPRRRATAPGNPVENVYIPAGGDVLTAP
jgi:exodeoxyribonuclease-3